MSEGIYFEAFYERNWKYVYRLCFTYVKNAADAEDCAEDVFVKVMNGGFTFEDETHEKKWLAVTAGNYCKDKLRSRRRKPLDYLEEITEPAAEEGDDNSDVLQAVMCLPPKYKEVVWLYYYDGYQTNEIAKMLRCPHSTVRNRLRDARERLRKALEGGDTYDRPR